MDIDPPKGGERKNPKHDVGSMGTQISARGPTDTFPKWGTSLLSRPSLLHYYGAHPSHCDQPFSISLVMSTSFNLRELDPLVTVPIFISNGTPTHFLIYPDQSRKECLKCDLCGRELLSKGGWSGHVLWRQRDGIVTGPQSACHPEPSLPRSLFGSNAAVVPIRLTVLISPSPPRS